MSEPAPPPGMARPPLPAAAALLAAALLHCAPAAPAHRHKPVSRDHPVPPSVSPAALRCCPEGSISPADPPLNGMSRLPPAAPSVPEPHSGCRHGQRCRESPAAGRLPLPRRCSRSAGSSWLVGKFPQPCSRGKNGERDKYSLGEDTASPVLYRQQSTRCCSNTPCTLCWQFREVLRGDETRGMNQRRRQERSSRALSSCICLPDPSTWDGAASSRDCGCQRRAAACEGFGGREKTESSLCWECVRA